MLPRVIRLFRAELAKTWRTKLPYVGLIASALMALIAQQSARSFSGEGTLTAPAYFMASINFATTTVVPLFATIFASMLVAGETTRGTLRTILTRPVSRADFLTAKLLSGLCYMLALMAANIIPALFIARNYPVYENFQRESFLPSPAGTAGIVLVGVLITLIPQVATVCFGFLVSVLSVNVATAIGLAVGVLLSLYTIVPFVESGGFQLEDWVFMSYWDDTMKVSGDMVMGVYARWNSEPIRMLFIVCGASIVAFLAIAYRRFLRRDLNI